MPRYTYQPTLADYANQSPVEVESERTRREHMYARTLATLAIKRKYEYVHKLALRWRVETSEAERVCKRWKRLGYVDLVEGRNHALKVYPKLKPLEDPILPDPSPPVPPA